MLIHRNIKGTPLYRVYQYKNKSPYIGGSLQFTEVKHVLDCEYQYYLLFIIYLVICVGNNLLDTSVRVHFSSFNINGVPQ